jgi:hypothetical protein
MDAYDLAEAFPGWQPVGPPPPLPPITAGWYVGLDLGQAQDPTALCVVEKTVRPRSDEPPCYSCRHLERFELGTPYPDVVAAVVKLLGQETPRGDRPLCGAPLVADATGVGAAVCDLFAREPAVAQLVRVVITAGTTAHYADGQWHCPKKELVAALQVLLQGGRLKVARELTLAEVLVKELLNFKVKVTASANETYEAWREGDHDDLVLALAVAVWFAERDPGPDRELPWVVIPGKQRW